MITSKNSEMAYVSPHGTGTEKSKTFWLKDLGSQYKIERTEDWEDCEGDEKSYGEMIRVKDSLPTYRNGSSPLTGKPNKIFYMSSNLYKYSETELSLYMKDHRNLWPKLAEITGENFNGFDHDEEDFIFPIEKFPEVAKLIQFHEKRKIPQGLIEGRKKTMFKPKHGYKDKMKGVNLRGNESGNVITSLDIFNGGNPL
jgi:hypothetical protein